MVKRAFPFEEPNPRGFLLHGTGSGVIVRDREAEFISTINYVMTGANGLGWNATIGEDMIAQHMEMNRWGWNAYEASPEFIAVEFAQPDNTFAITDSQVKTFCWFVQQVQRVYPNIPLKFYSHAEAEHFGWTVETSGKVDPYPFGDARMDDLRTRIYARLGL